MKRTVSSLAITAALLVAPRASEAQVTISLNFDLLPSAQGWTFFQSSVPEASVFHVNGSSLFQDTIGTGFGHGNPNYAMFGVVDGQQPFVLTVRARVLATEGGGPYPFCFEVRTASPNQEYFVGLTTSRVTIPSGSFPLDTTVFHEYVIARTLSGSYSVYVDGQLRGSGPPPSPGAGAGALNALQLGDEGDLDGNARAEVTKFEFSQPATYSPPPAFRCGSERFLPPFDVPIKLNRNQQRAIPIKMVLYDQAGNLVDADQLTAPVVSITYAVGGGTGIDLTSELLPVGAAYDGNEFRFDPDSSSWIYNLSTKPYGAPGTYYVAARSGSNAYSIGAECSGSFLRIP